MNHCRARPPNLVSSLLFELSIDESLLCKTSKLVSCYGCQWFDRSEPSNTNHSLSVLEEEADCHWDLLVDVGGRERAVVEIYMAGRNVKIYMARTRGI
jgi:hypothetical protein